MPTVVAPRSVVAAPRSVVSALLGSVLVALVATAAVLVATKVEASSPGFLVSCPYVKTLPDDPIVKPGLAGGSHQHDFLGNRSTHASSTYSSMQAAKTSCVLGADTAAYWVPSLYRNGVQVKPTASGTRQQVYYRDNNLKPGTLVETIPADLRLVAGNAAARGVSENPLLGREIFWGCSDNSTGKLTQPPGGCATGIITLHVGFPNCWNGKQTRANDSAHLTYPRSGVCPAAFPRALPRVILRMEYPVGTTTGRITLASGQPYTAHADFWNAWQQPRLNSLVQECLNLDTSCGKPTS